MLQYLIGLSKPWPKGVDGQLRKFYRTTWITPDLDDVIEIFIELLPATPGIVCIIDGLDEFEDRELERVQKAIRDIFQLGTSHRAKVFITCRKSLDVDPTTFKAIHVPISSNDHEADILHYVETSIEEKTAYVR